MHNLTPPSPTHPQEDVRKKATTLSFPTSIVEYFQGYLGVPPHGFPEPLRSDVICTRSIPGTDKTSFEGRPGAEMSDFDFEATKKLLTEKWGTIIRDCDVMSAAMYPAVFDEWMEKRKLYGKSGVMNLPTRNFIAGMERDEEIVIGLQDGVALNIKLLNASEPDGEGMATVDFELNGSARRIRTKDVNVETSTVVRAKASPGKIGEVGASMQSVVVETRVRSGDKVKAGDPLIVLSAMKMETLVTAPCDGRVKFVGVTVGDGVAQGDLMVEIDEE